jgi:peptidylprolyl isomerase
MKKSEKTKGKVAAEARKKTLRTYGIVIAVGVVIIAIAAFLILMNPVVAKTGDTVEVYYTGLLDNGSIFDQNLNKTPLEFTLGAGNVIQGFDEAVTGMAVNSEKTVHIPVDKAYGPYNPALVVTVNRSSFPTDQEPIIGSHWSVSTPSGATGMVKIVNVTPKTITVDENNDVAGENLTFIIKLVKIVTP